MVGEGDGEQNIRQLTTEHHRKMPTGTLEVLLVGCKGLEDSDFLGTVPLLYLYGL